MGFFKNQLRSIVQWEDPAPDQLFHLYQERNDELKNKSTLILQPGQGCLLVYEGKPKDCLLTPGSYNIETDNIPFITSLASFLNGFESKHKTALCFFKTIQVTGAHWGTADTIEYIDPVYKIPVGINAFGTYTFSVKDPLFFFENFVGPVAQFAIASLESVINQRLGQPLVQLLATARVSVMELDSQRIALSSQLQTALNDILVPLGLVLNDFRITGMSHDKATVVHLAKIAAVGTDMYNAEQTGLRYEEMQRLQAMRDAATNEGGTAGIGVGAAAGLAISQDMMKPLFSSNTGGNDIEKRLLLLQDLLAKQLISDAEFQERKKQILNEI